MNVKTLLQNASGEFKTISSEAKELSQVHAQLLKIEAQECADFIKKKVVTGILTALTTFFLVCVLLITGISALGVYIEQFLQDGLKAYSWHLVAGSVSLFFLLFILICVGSLKKKPQEAFFSQTKNEIQNDKVWLQSLTKRKSNRS